MNNSEFTFPLIHNSIGIMTPFLLAALGGLMTELSGMLNIALEGLILFGAFFSVVFTYWSGSIFTGILGGIAVTLFFAWLFGAVTLYLKANVFITGLATNLLAGGLITVLSFAFFKTKGVLMFRNMPSLPELNIPALNSIPLIGDILSGHNILVYFGWLMVFLAWVLINKTTFGLRLRGSGINPDAMRAAGISPSRYRMYAILISGFSCALAGAVLTLNLGAYTPNISAGRGWIALVVIYLGGKRPLGILGASFIFGLAESISNYAQGFMDISADFLLAFPYLLTVAAMVIMSVLKKKREGDSYE